jgi:hypothetical protein
METLIPVNIVIGDRNYRIKVSPADEEHVRKTIKIINDKIVEFKTNFAGKDMQDYVAMVLVWYATQVGLENKNAPVSDDTEATEALKKMQQQIDSLLNTIS